MLKEIVFITGNEQKFNEAKKLIAPLGYELMQKNPGYPEIQSSSLEGVARYGIEHLKKKNDTFFLEDSGLFIQALDGFPGVYSKFVFGTIGNEGILTLMKKMENRNAVFRAVIGFYDGEPKVFKGECKGKIAKELQGSHGFGYDPIFIPRGSKKTFGAMSTHRKNEYSHRGKALKSFVSYLKKR
ncbi:MAG: XTP/dITP diphosphatase [Euryarchaeota archaeon]|nr:XTP/dITP diphosphatase [Euryarchaeota archaeon]